MHADLGVGHIKLRQAIDGHPPGIPPWTDVRTPHFVLGLYQLALDDA